MRPSSCGPKVKFVEARYLGEHMGAFNSMKSKLSLYDERGIYHVVLKAPVVLFDRLIFMNRTHAAHIVLDEITSCLLDRTERYEGIRR